MKDNENSFLNASSIIGSLALVVMSFIHTTWIFSFSSIVLMIFCSFLPLFKINMLARRFLLKTYLKPGSPAYEFLKDKAVLTFGISLSLATIVSFCAYVELVSMSLFEIIIVGVSYFAGRFLVISCSNPLKMNLNDELIEYVSLKFTLFLSTSLMLIILAGFSLAHGANEDYSKITADEMATKVNAKIKTSIITVRHISRTIEYSELLLLKARDMCGGLIGWSIYLFFLIPHALPAIGFVCFFLNLELLFTRGYESLL